MGRNVQIVSEDFIRGLLDTQNEVGLEAGWAKFENLRIGRARGEQRKGMAHLATASDSDQQAMDFDGATDYFEIPNRGALPKVFQMEIAFQADTIAAGIDYLRGIGHANYGLKVRRNAADIEILIHDGANSATHNAGAILAAKPYVLRLRYDGTTLQTWLQSEANAATVQAESGTVSGRLRAPGGNIVIGGDGAVVSNFWDGKIEFVRAFGKHLDDDFRHLWGYWPHPKGRYVLHDYICALLDGQNQLIDHSRNLNYGTRQGTPSPITTLLLPTDPVQAITQHVDRENESRLVVVAGGVPYEEVI